MRHINVRTFMIAAVSAAVLAGTVVPANAADLPAAPSASTESSVITSGDTAKDKAPAKDEATFTPWTKDATGWRFDKSGVGKAYAQNEKVEIDGAVYRFDSLGYMVTGWYDAEGKWEYYAPSGAQVFGWKVIDGSWYYLDPNTGIMHTGWLELDGTWYYLNASGDMAMGWIKYNNEWYYLGGSGAMVTGWAKVDGTWYYMNQNGVMLIGWVKVNGTWYYMNTSGAMVTGTQWIGGERHWFYGNGAWWGVWK